MKRITLILVLTFSCLIVNAQNRDAVGHRVGSWNVPQVFECYKGFIWRVRKNYYSDTKNDFINEYEIKNNYNSTVSFSYEIGSSPNLPTQFRKTLKPGETYTNKRCQNVEFVYLHITDVCFNNNCKSNCFADCDNGTPNQSNCNESKNSNIIQSDSKSDKNNTSFQELYKKGMTSIESKQYNEAENYLNEALKVAVNDEQRNNVAQWLNELKKNKSNTTSPSSPNVILPSNDNDFLKQPSFSTEINSIVNNTTPLILQGIENMQKFKIEQQELYNKIKNNEAKYPEAISHYNKFLKYKKKSNIVLWSGIGVMGVGLCLTLGSIVPEEPSIPLLLVGTGVTLVGTGIMIASIPIIYKSKTNYDNAKKIVASIELKSNEFSFALNF